MTRPGQLKKFEARGQMGLGFAIEEMCHIPESRWQAPDMFNLPDRLAGDIGVDTENRDNGLNAEQGPGWPWRGGGHVCGYAIEDSVLPREIWKIQKPLIESEGLTRIAALEHALLPMYIGMRRRGVRVNLDRAEQLKEQLEGEIAEQIAIVKHGTGINVSIWEPESLAAVLDSIHIQFPRTPVNRQPSITNDLLENARNWITDALLKAREKDKL